MRQNKTSRAGSFFRGLESKELTEHTEPDSGHRASKGHLPEAFHLMWKEEGAPETLHQKAEPLGHLQMVVPTGTPIHLLPHRYSGATARQGQKKIGVPLLQREGDHAGPG